MKYWRLSRRWEPTWPKRGLIADLYVVGGAAIALAYDERRATRDIDAVFAPKKEVYAAAARIGAALDLPDGWLNDAVKGFLQGPDTFPTTILDMPVELFVRSVMDVTGS